MLKADYVPQDRWTGSIVFTATVREFAPFNNSFVIPIANAVLSNSTCEYRNSPAVSALTGFRRFRQSIGTLRPRLLKTRAYF
jgi:hypothetical protein